MTDETDWATVAKNIHWAMTDLHADLMGQRLMYDACNANDQGRMGEFKNGFHQAQRDTAEQARFDSCAAINQGRVYGIGRGFMGESAVTLRNRGIQV